MRVILRQRAVFLGKMAILFLVLGLYGEWIGLEPYWHPFA